MKMVGYLWVRFGVVSHDLSSLSVRTASNVLRGCIILAVRAAFSVPPRCVLFLLLRSTEVVTAIGHPGVRVSDVIT